jgi:hypothetical protein
VVAAEAVERVRAEQSALRAREGRLDAVRQELEEIARPHRQPAPGAAARLRPSSGEDRRMQSPPRIPHGQHGTPQRNVAVAEAVPPTSPSRFPVDCPTTYDGEYRRDIARIERVIDVAGKQQVG